MKSHNSIFVIFLVFKSLREVAACFNSMKPISFTKGNFFLVVRKCLWRYQCTLKMER